MPLLLDCLKGGAATVLLFLAYLSLPVIGLVLGVFVPYPATHYALLRGRPAGIAIVAISAAAIGAATGPANIAIFFCFFGIISLLLPLFLSRGMGAARSLGFTLVVNVFVVALVVAAIGLVKGIDVNALVVKGIQTAIEQSAQIYEKSGLTGDELKQFQDALREAGGLISRIYPALMVVALGAIAGFNLMLLKRRAAKFPVQLEFGRFSSFKNPDHLIWVLIAAGFSLLADNSLVEQTSLNLLIVILPLYFLQGMAVAVALFDRHGVSPFMRTMFYIFLVVFQFLAIVITAIGIFDMWGDFRTPRQKENL